MIIETLVIMMPPYATYTKEQLDKPNEQPNCEKVRCTHCNQPAWLSAKKRTLISHAEMCNIEVYTACYDCIRLKAHREPEWFKSHMRIDI